MKLTELSHNERIHLIEYHKSQVDYVLSESMSEDQINEQIGMWHLLLGAHPKYKSENVFFVEGDAWNVKEIKEWGDENDIKVDKIKLLKRRNVGCVYMVVFEKDRSAMAFKLSFG